MENLKFQSTLCLTADELDALLKEEVKIFLSQEEVDEFIEQLKSEMNKKEAA